MEFLGKRFEDSHILKQNSETVHFYGVLDSLCMHLDISWQKEELENWDLNTKLILLKKAQICYITTTKNPCDYKKRS
jgi:hypothetical protein